MKLVLLSGGHDSANLVRMHRENCAALFIDYGQEVAVQEICAASEVAFHFGVFLYRRQIPSMEKKGDIWLGRNLALVGAAVPVAMDLDCDEILIGCTEEDWERFPDCRPGFIENLSQATEQAYRVRVSAPLKQRPSYIVPGTWSCYQDRPSPCGECWKCTRWERV